MASLKSQLQDRVDALAMRLGVMNAHVIRLNALGKRLMQMAHINSREFDFDDDPPQGGSESDGVGRGAQVPDLTSRIDDLGRRIDSRSGQFAALENVIVGRQLSLEIKPSGRPVREGYISSYFGERMDPFNGEDAFHKGVDFASDAGTDVLAVASGIVTWAGPREGYGNLVEINHGNGLRDALCARGPGPWSRSAMRSSAARRWRWSDPPAARPARTCISKCSRTAARSIRWRSSGTDRSVSSAGAPARLLTCRHERLHRVTVYPYNNGFSDGDFRYKRLKLLVLSKGLFVLQALTRVFGSRNDRLVKSYTRLVREATAQEPALQALSDEALRAKTVEFRARLQQGATLDQLLPEAFAVVREAARRTLKMRHFDVQLIGGMALHQGKIAEMRTGEGKTLMSTLPAYLNALPGRGRARGHGQRIPGAARRRLDGAGVPLPRAHASG